VILPSTLKFNTGAPEVMELVEGECRVRLAGSEAGRGMRAGSRSMCREFVVRHRGDAGAALHLPLR
jgi:uncharacterized protein YaiE (UPF0345 family)